MAAEIIYIHLYVYHYISVSVRPMEYKTTLLNEKAYSRLNRAKSALSARAGRRYSSSDLVNEVLSSSIDYLGIGDDLRRYINAVAGILGKKGYVLGVMLFGSVAKGSFDAYSDIDLLIVVDESVKKMAVLQDLMDARRSLGESEALLFREHLPTSISPLVMRTGEFGEFAPIYLDFLDYGITLYDYRDTLSGIMSSIRKVRHRREYTQYGEMVTW